MGGTEKAACHWATGLAGRGHAIHVFVFQTGPWEAELNHHGIEVSVLPFDVNEISSAIRGCAPDAIHMHAPGNAHRGEILEDALRLIGKIPVVQTNVFGLLDNPREHGWVDFRLFVSWTSAVQAARRSFRRLDRAFLSDKSVAVNPLPLPVEPPAERVREYRSMLGVLDNEVLFGRFSRPSREKWTDMPVQAFRLARRKNARIKLLLREPPEDIARDLRASPDRDSFVILPATSDVPELVMTMSAVDVVLHASTMGESFGYGIAEPMSLGKPVIANTVPWGDQAQIELVRPGECGSIVGTVREMAKAISAFAQSPDLCRSYGERGRIHIRALADVDATVERLEQCLISVASGRENPFIDGDLAKLKETADYLDRWQFGSSVGEQLALRPFYYRVRFHEWRKALKRRLTSRNQASSAHTA